MADRPESRLRPVQPGRARKIDLQRITRTDGVEVRDDDAARLSPFRHRHVNMLGKYSFFLPAGLAGGAGPPA
ncbi:hypothetical protein [Actinoallomurus sp. CA-150999]|uniref:hypothetical protein n=1 Tax=Actinoallomurus sp. CA-150999 TaxID=3239887 RepID=UPI003D8F145D